MAWTEKFRVSLYSVDGLETHPCCGVCIEIPGTVEQVPSRVGYHVWSRICVCCVQLLLLGGLLLGIDAKRCYNSYALQRLLECAWVSWEWGRDCSSPMRADLLVPGAWPFRDCLAALFLLCSCGGRIDDIDMVQAGEALFLSSGGPSIHPPPKTTSAS